MKTTNRLLATKVKGTIQLTKDIKAVRKVDVTEGGLPYGDYTIPIPFFYTTTNARIAQENWLIDLSKDTAQHRNKL